ncbi:MAG: Uma2 family endonuclease [Pleurocapsa sp. SU_196_0]|nr:Uma2 family endonuclease [Pleurocapsa sp. SU_196_0]
MTIEEYLEAERHSEVRHEFVGGLRLPMPASTRRHGAITLNILTALDDIAVARGCELHALDIMTRTVGGRIRYPDIVLSRDPGNHRYFLENPCFIAEVTSDSTADTDHGKKLEEYSRIPSLERYAIVSQVERLVVLYDLRDGSRTFEVISEMGDFAVPCLETRLNLDQIYAGVTF